MSPQDFEFKLVASATKRPLHVECRLPDRSVEEDVPSGKHYLIALEAGDKLYVEVGEDGSLMVQVLEAKPLEVFRASLP